MKQNKKNYLSPAITVFAAGADDVIATSYIWHDGRDNYHYDPFGTNPAYSNPKDAYKN